MAGVEARPAVGTEARPATGHPVQLLHHRSPGSTGKLRLNSRTLGRAPPLPPAVERMCYLLGS
uniref:Uncharacterized protein n=1 Tax=Oryza glumipatula TaxID=40148 RepID=A0A0E0AW20_9ORYZ